MRYITKELIQVGTCLQNEQSTREESDAAITDMLRVLTSRVQTELEVEKKSRYSSADLSSLIQGGERGEHAGAARGGLQQDLGRGEDLTVREVNVSR